MPGSLQGGILNDSYVLVFLGQYNLYNVLKDMCNPNELKLFVLNNIYSINLMGVSSVIC